MNPSSKAVANNLHPAIYFKPFSSARIMRASPYFVKQLCITCHPLVTHSI